MLHIKFTMIILFLNISLLVFMPNVVIGDNVLFTTDANDQYTTTSGFNNAFGGVVDRESGLPVSQSLGITDIITLLWGVIELLFDIFFSSFIVLYYLYQIGNTWALVLGIPLIVSYGLAIVGWVK